MDSENSNTDRSEPCVPREVLLRYLLSRCDSTHHRFRLGFTFRFLGFAALYEYKDLLQVYQDIHLPGYSPVDRLMTYRRVFREALDRLRDTPLSALEYQEMPHNSESSEPEICERLLATAIRDATTMLERGDYTLESVFLLVSWLGLRFDPDALRDFERHCIGSDAEPDLRIKTGLAILKKALGRKPRVSPQN